MTNSTKSQGSAENRGLAALPGEVYDRLLPNIQPISFALGGVVYESSEQMEHLYFPTTCIVSSLYTMTNGATAEMGLVGNDGVVGIALLHDGVQSAELRLTQEFTANMLGGRRESVTKAARHLQTAGLIRYVRGHIPILDRRGLEAASCECYQVVKIEFDRLLG